MAPSWTAAGGISGLSQRCSERSTRRRLSLHSPTMTTRAMLRPRSLSSLTRPDARAVAVTRRVPYMTLEWARSVMPGSLRCATCSTANTKRDPSCCGRHGERERASQARPIRTRAGRSKGVATSCAARRQSRSSCQRKRWRTIGRGSRKSRGSRINSAPSCFIAATHNQRNTRCCTARRQVYEAGLHVWLLQSTKSKRVTGDIDDAECPPRLREMDDHLFQHMEVI
mmetsp:Transcript_4502/g.11889  ORF Transcript_4502/g.11889 Transcript_4502/m.11889 type:complete len:226 (-) Transcript_4502:47-724(-)